MLIHCEPIEPSLLKIKIMVNVTQMYELFLYKYKGHFYFQNNF